MPVNENTWYSARLKNVSRKMQLANVKEPFQGESAFIFITAINVAKWIFFSTYTFKTLMYLFHSSICHCKDAGRGDGSEKKCDRDILGGALV